MDLEGITLSEISQTEKEEKYMISLICGIYKNGTNELIYQTEIELQMQKRNFWLPGGKWGDG